MSEASSTVFAPARTAKRARGLSSDSAGSASVAEDEASGAGAEAKHRRKRGKSRTTNIVDVIRAREKERKEERRKEREEWVERRMADPNLEIPPARNLPSVEDVMGELETDCRHHIRCNAGGMDHPKGGDDGPKPQWHVCALVEDGGS